MKKKAILLTAILALFAASCGSSSSTPVDVPEELEAAGEAFDEVFDSVADCVAAALDADPTATSITCDCPGGGSVTIAIPTATSATLTMTDCISSSSTGSQEFGTIAGSPITASFNDDYSSATLNGAFVPFGECTSVTGNNIKIGDTCGGTLAVVCPDGSANCSIASDCSGEFSCTE